MLWQTAYGGEDDDQGYGILETSDGGYLVTGMSTTYGTTSPSGYRIGGDAWILRLDTTGELLWEASYGGRGNDEFRFSDQLSDGGFLLGGDTDAFEGGIQFWLLRIDSMGSPLWHRTAGSVVEPFNGDYLKSMVPTSDGGYLLAGSTDLSPPHNWILMKLDASGCAADPRTSQLLYSSSDPMSVKVGKLSASTQTEATAEPSQATVQDVNPVVSSTSLEPLDCGP